MDMRGGKCGWRLWPIVVVGLSIWSGIGRGASAWSEPVGEIPDAEFERLLGEVKPQPGESPWREIPWLTDVTEARRRAIAEDKPLVIFTAADGSPLGRT